jgi:hypothetical protein
MKTLKTLETSAEPSGIPGLDADVAVGRAILDYLRSTRPPVDYETRPLISLKNRYVYFAIGKVANSSVKSLLYRCELAGTSRKPPRDKQVHNVLQSPLIMPYQLSDADMSRLLVSSDFRKVAFVRNPYDRLLSCFLDRVQAHDSLPHRKTARILGIEPGSDISFEAFVSSLPEQINADVHWRPQWVELGDGRIDFAFVGKFEKLAEDIESLVSLLYPGRSAKLGFQSPARTNAAQRRAEFYTQSTIDIVRELYADDFDHFGYET